MKVKECVGSGSALRRKILLKGLEQLAAVQLRRSFKHKPAAGLRRASQNPGLFLKIQAVSSPIDTKWSLVDCLVDANIYSITITSSCTNLSPGQTKISFCWVKTSQ